jgi:hypothetical protein
MASVLFERQTPAVDDMSGKYAKFILDTNVLIGGRLRMRQLRVKPMPCERRPPKLQNFTKVCYPPFSPDAESREAYGPSQVFRWYELPDSSKLNYWGQLGEFTPTGFVQDLGPTYEAAVNDLRFLEQQHWIDVQTRAVLIDFALYNPTTHLFLVVRITFEMPYVLLLLLPLLFAVLFLC